MTTMRTLAALTFVALTSFGLFGCATTELAESPVSVPMTEPPLVWATATSTPGLAGQNVAVQYTALAVQQTQADLQVQVVEATAQAQGTLDARSEAATASAATATTQAESFNFQQTLGAATQAAKETELAFNITMDAATQAAGATQSGERLTATAVVQLSERRASENVMAGWFTAVFFTLLAGIVLWYAIRIGRGLARRSDPHHDPNSVRVIRTTVGPVLIVPLPQGGFTRELLALPAAQLSTFETEASFDTDEELPDEPEEAPIYTNGHLSGFYNRAQSQRQLEAAEVNRKFLLWFLRKCINVSGRASTTIPPHDRVEVATETWAKATDLLHPLIEKRRGRNGGTWLVGEYPTLGEVWLAVGERRYTPLPSSKRVVLEQSPAPASSVWVN